MADREATLREVLGHKVKRNSFVDFCKREHCAENLLFYNAVCDFEEASDDAARLEKASDILTTYVKAGAVEQVNMTDESREMLCERVAAGEVPEDLFASFKVVAFKDMCGDTLPRYLKSDLYEAVREATAGGGGELVMASCQYTDVLSRLRKKKILGIKVKQRHSKADVKAFDKLGSEMRASTRKAGFLMKRGGNHQNWKRRWCVLSALGLGYFLDEYRYAPKGAVLAHEMTGVKADMDEETGMKFTLAITTKSRVYVIQAANHRDRARWVTALEAAVANPVLVPATSQ